jgi:hypothetical protein
MMNMNTIGPINGRTAITDHQRVFPTRLQIDRAGMSDSIDQMANGSNWMNVSMFCRLTKLALLYRGV